MYLSIGAEVIVTDTRFKKGIATTGGAIYAVGEATLAIEACEFTDNSALNSGGAIFLSNFKGVNITRNSKFRNNNVILAFGADIAAVNGMLRHGRPT